VKSEIPDANPVGYADDTGMTSTCVETVQDTLTLTGSFAVVTGQVLNASKSKCWTTDSSHDCEIQELILMNESVPCSKGGRLF